MVGKFKTRPIPWFGLSDLEDTVYNIDSNQFQKSENTLHIMKNTLRNYLHGLQNSGESMGDSGLHADFGPITL